jgi:uncharacterized protein (DUF1501 family)
MCEHLSRRAALSAISAAALAPWVHAKAANPDQGRMVWVMLRGAADGLSIVVPHSDPRYTQLRSSTAIPAPDGTANTALALDARFGLHPALSGLMPWWPSSHRQACLRLTARTSMRNMRWRSASTQCPAKNRVCSTPWPAS